MKATIPVCFRTSADSFQSAYTMTVAMTKTVAPRTTSTPAQARSGRFLRAGSMIRESRPGRRATRVSLAGCKGDGLSLYGHLLECGLHLLHDGLRQRSIVEGSGRLLAIVDGPPEEVQQFPPLHRIGLVPVHEDIGERSDWVRVLARLVRDG